MIGIILKCLLLLACVMSPLLGYIGYTILVMFVPESIALLQSIILGLLPWLLLYISLYKYM